MRSGSSCWLFPGDEVGRGLLAGPSWPTNVGLSSLRSFGARGARHSSVRSFPLGKSDPLARFRSLPGTASCSVYDIDTYPTVYLAEVENRTELRQDSDISASSISGIDVAKSMFLILDENAFRNFTV